ncbi:MAG: MerR family transcriptional regulator [Bacteroidales bacterium]|nr:MerR family transcriptional regulator [Bacteroidales bacterium]
MKNIELDPEKMFYSIGEVAKMFDENTSLIRFWEKEFNIIKPKKNAKGNRLFTPADIENFKLIHYYVKDLGLTLEGAKKKLKEGNDDGISKMQIVEKLTAIKNQLTILKENM